MRSTRHISPGWSCRCRNWRSTRGWSRKPVSVECRDHRNENRGDVRFSVIVHERSRSLLAKPKAWTPLNGERQVIGRLTRFHVIMFTEMVEQSIRAFERAGLVRTNADNLPANLVRYKRANKTRSRHAHLQAAHAVTLRLQRRPPVEASHRSFAQREGQAVAPSVPMEYKISIAGCSGVRSISDMDTPICRV